MKVVVITSNGFLTYKDPKDVKDNDTKIFSGTEEECINMIHGNKVF